MMGLSGSPPRFLTAFCSAGAQTSRHGSGVQGRDTTADDGDAIADVDRLAQAYLAKEGRRRKDPLGGLAVDPQ